MKKLMIVVFLLLGIKGIAQDSGSHMFEGLIPDEVEAHYTTPPNLTPAPLPNVSSPDFNKPQETQVENTQVQATREQITQAQNTRAEQVEKDLNKVFSAPKTYSTRTPTPVNTKDLDSDIVNKPQEENNSIGMIFIIIIAAIIAIMVYNGHNSSPSPNKVKQIELDQKSKLLDLKEREIALNERETELKKRENKSNTDLS